MKVGMVIRRITSLILIFGVLLFPAPPNVSAKSSQVTFTLGRTGVALEQPDTLLVAVQLNNTETKRTAFRVRINSVQLKGAALLTPLPVVVGTIPARQTATIQMQFDGSQLVEGKLYKLVIRGSYRPKDRGTQQDQGHVFTLTTWVQLPPASPGSAVLDSVDIPSDEVSGAPFPARPPISITKANPAGPPVPIGSFVPGTPTLTTTNVQDAPLKPASQNKKKADAAGSVVFLTNSSTGVTAGVSTTAEPSGGATADGVVLLTANWTAAYSTDGGNTFIQRDPTTVFPNDAVGFCCDQIVQYVPSIDRFIWLLQGNGYRLASASPAALVSSGATAWTYWNLTPNVFGSCGWFDYPDLAVGNNSLYMSWDAGDGGCGGFQVARTSLAGIQAGGTITIEFTDPANGGMAWGSHLSQNTGDEIFWAGHNSSSQMRIFSLQEGSNTYFWRDRGISSWPNNAPTSTTPDGPDWLCKNFNGCTGNGAFPGNGVIGATRSGNQVWFAWSAGTDNNFPQAHIQMVALDRSDDFDVTQQVQIWNPDYAFAYPVLATNFCTGEVGLSFEFGGGGNYENHVVGFWGDFIAYITTGSNVGTNRFGDYVTIRQQPATNDNPGNLFSAFGYGLNIVPGSGTRTDIHYVLFGRPPSSCNIIE